MVRSSGCTVCGHRRLAYIEGLMRTEGRTLASIHRETGVSYDALARHRRSHLDPEPAAPPSMVAPPSPPSSDATPLDIMREVVDELRKTDVSKLSGRVKTDHLDLLRRATETLGRMAPPAMPDEAEMDLLADRPRGIQRFVADLYLFAEKMPGMLAVLTRIASGDESASLPPTVILERERAEIAAGVHPYVALIDGMLETARKRDDERGRAA